MTHYREPVPCSQVEICILLIISSSWLLLTWVTERYSNSLSRRLNKGHFRLPDGSWIHEFPQNRSDAPTRCAKQEDWCRVGSRTCQLDSHVCLNDESRIACKVGPDGREVDTGIENTSELWKKKYRLPKWSHRLGAVVAWQHGFSR